jgi:hypothetical protein
VTIFEPGEVQFLSNDCLRCLPHVTVSFGVCVYVCVCVCVCVSERERERERKRERAGSKYRVSGISFFLVARASSFCRKCLTLSLAAEQSGPVTLVRRQKATLSLCSP